MQSAGQIRVPLALAGIVAAVVGMVALGPFGWEPSLMIAPADEGIEPVAAKINASWERRWSEHRITPAARADDLLLARRLTLALHGRPPSLQEVRDFESDDRPDRVRRWLEELLADRRFADYLAQRLARALIANPNDNFHLYRRGHYIGWLSDQIHAGRPYDKIVYDTLAAEGLPNNQPETNFLTSELVLEEDYEQRLAARAVRAYLGQRIDCAQCHDHPFADWRQADFQGLAAFFGGVEVSRGGVYDSQERRLEIVDRTTDERRKIDPRVPFDEELLPHSGERRQRLAGWVTDPGNRRFSRAIVNRLWGLMFGRPLISPVDDIPDPSETSDESALLDLLADDFLAHDFDLRRTIRVIAASRVFTLDSAHADMQEPGKCEQLEANWAVFPLTPLRFEQLLGSFAQVASLRPVDPRSSLFAQAHRINETERFEREFGQPGQDEFEERPTTIPQTLLSMNGPFVNRASDANLLTAAGRIAWLSGADAQRLEDCYLACLTRRPTEPEEKHFADQIDRERRSSSSVVKDVYWSLLNSPEFTWNH